MTNQNQDQFQELVDNFMDAVYNLVEELNSYKEEDLSENEIKFLETFHVWYEALPEEDE